VLEESREIQVLRFKRVVFGVASSPFLLNATIRHHIETNENPFPQVASTLLRSMYVDDLVCGAQCIEEAYRLFSDSKKLLRSGGFNLHKFVSNSLELQNQINKRENAVDIATNDYRVLGV
uniref:Reverse transcriptase domain-containing protein n=1 Tax=Amphimedon queenslandica TaxID=400682 RepID=A0A1X7TTP1_AMPQE